MLRKSKSSISSDLTDLPTPYIYGQHISMGQRIRTALESGVSETSITPKNYDDSTSSDIDPLSDIRNDRFFQAEVAHNDALYQQNRLSEPDATTPTPSAVDVATTAENTPTV